MTDIHITIDDSGFAVMARCVVKHEEGLSVGYSSVHPDANEALRRAFDFARAEIEEAA